MELQLAIARASGYVEFEEHISISTGIFPKSDFARGTIDTIGSGRVDRDLEGWVDGCAGTLSGGDGGGRGGCGGGKEKEDGCECGEELHFWLV